MKLSYGVGLLTAIGLTFGQTLVDIRTQTKNIDFSRAPSVRPFPTGTSLPATCNPGEMFFKTDAAAGANLYGCVTPNSWVVQSVISVGGSSTAPAGFDTRAVGTVLTIGLSCSAESACRALIGSVMYSYPAPATATLTGGSGVAYVYVDVIGNLTVGYGGSSSQYNNITCAGCTAVFNVTAFPDNSFPIAKANWTNGIWEEKGLLDERTAYNAPLNIEAGPNVLVTPAPGGVQISATGNGTFTAPSSSYVTVQNGGTSVLQRTTLNFTGAGVTCSDDSANSRTSCNVPAGGSGGGSSYDASDVTVFDNTFYMSTLSYSNVPGAFWGFTGGTCAGVFNLDNSAAGQIALSFWQTSSGMCILFAPSTGGSVSGGISDFVSGTNPLPYKEEIQYARKTSTGDGDHYIGLSQAPSESAGTFDNFVGIRGNSAAGQWQCVIRKNGADVASTNIMPIDTLTHWFRIDNGTGSANSVTCRIGGATATATGSIPAGTWFAVAGAINIAGSTPRFYIGEARLHISSRAAN